MDFIFKMIGSIVIVVGIFLAATIWSDAASTPFGRMAAHYTWIGGLLSGLFFMGFGRLLELLVAIRDRLPVAESGEKTD